MEDKNVNFHDFNHLWKYIYKAVTWVKLQENWHLYVKLLNMFS